jgi:hypothetical protein
MPALSTKTKHYYRERIRSILVQTPQVSNEGIRQRLQRDGLTLDRHYIGKLVGEIHTERSKRADTWTLNMALSSFQDAMGEIVRVGWTIANDDREQGRDRAAALREIREAYNAVFEKLFDAGVAALANHVQPSNFCARGVSNVRPHVTNWSLRDRVNDGPDIRLTTPFIS